ncbi:ATP-dependent zinc protease family protein [Wohlfahrtiimonas chitiniclastica]|uniref:ATP-dependent zinc protease family protein n=1 Tax=Wohlfahrtiimonas chitiniclastica TaxID=400946 RepID=UPI00037B3282|nr:RimK/LysX family protein [Wohlfahrtiimonas chitiniclastica]
MKTISKFLLLFPLFFAPVLAEEKSDQPTESTPVQKPEVVKHVYGHDEQVVLPQLNNIQLHAKLDTGAKTASLSAKEIKIFTKNKEKWVRFQLEKNNKTYEFPIKRMSRIKNREGERMHEGVPTSSERPVIELEICLGNQSKKMEVNLQDRSRFQYPILIGKVGLIKLKAVVDPALSETTQPNCQQ